MTTFISYALIAVAVVWMFRMHAGGGHSRHGGGCGAHGHGSDQRQAARQEPGSPSESDAPRERPGHDHTHA